MTPHDLIPPTGPAAPRRFLPVLLVLFVGSGCAALIYEVVWLQLLQLVIGSTAVSLGVLLGTFMGGMCAGSLLLPRLVSGRRHPLQVYALLELGIGAIGLVVLFGMPYVEQVYVRYAGHGPPGILLRGAVAGVCLLPPTLLMGATLPAMARWVETSPEGVSWRGFFYGGNIAGAVLGCLLAGFHLLPDPGRVPDRPGDRQQPRGIPGAAGRVGAGGAGRLPVAPDRGHRLDRGHDREVAPLLADRPRAVAEPLVHLPARPGALPLGRPAAGVPVGGELPAGAGGGRLPRPGPRPAGRGGLRGQHARRHRRRPGVQPAAGPRPRHRRRRAGADRAGRGGRASDPDPPARAGARNGAPGRRG